MQANKVPVTPAVRLLRERHIDYRSHVFKYQHRGGAEQGAQALGIDPHILIKTLILQSDNHQALIVMMHGDREVSTKNLARQLGVKAVQMCLPEVATRHSGYQLGGTSPFATRKPLPAYLEASVLDLPTIYINGGKRGFLLEMSPNDLQQLLAPTLVKVAVST